MISEKQLQKVTVSSSIPEWIQDNEERLNPRKCIGSKNFRLDFPCPRCRNSPEHDFKIAPKLKTLSHAYHHILLKHRSDLFNPTYDYLLVFLQKVFLCIESGFDYHELDEFQKWSRKK